MRIWLGILFALIPTAVLAQVQLGLFSVQEEDRSLYYLKQIFGNFGYIIDAGNLHSPILGQMYLVLNALAFTIGILFTLYTGLMAVIHTAGEGTFLGKKGSAFWGPVKIGFGLLLLLPTASGYSNVQIGVMWFVLNGIGAANAVWTAMLNANYFAPPVDAVNTATDVRLSDETIGGLFKMAACMEFFDSGIADREATAPRRDQFVALRPPGSSSTRSINPRNRIAPNALPFAAFEEKSSVVDTQNRTLDLFKMTNNVYITAQKLDGLAVSGSNAPNGATQHICGNFLFPNFRQALDSSAASVKGDIPATAYLMNRRFRERIREIFSDLNSVAYDFMTIYEQPAADRNSYTLWSSYSMLEGARQSIMEAIAEIGMESNTPHRPLAELDAIIRQQQAQASSGLSDTAIAQAGVSVAAGAIGDAFGSDVGNAVSAAGNWTIGAGNTIANTANDVADWTTGAIDSIRDFFDDPLGLGAANEGYATGWFHAGSFYFKLLRDQKASDAVMATVMSPTRPDRGSFARVLQDTDAQVLFAAFEQYTNSYLTGYINYRTSLQNSLTTSSRQLHLTRASSGSIAGWYPMPDMMSEVSSFGDMIFNQHPDPLYSMSRFGQKVMLGVEAAWMAMMLVIFGMMMVMCFDSCMSPMSMALQTAVDIMLVLANIMVVLVWVPAATLGLYVPLVPYFVYLVTTLGWLILVIEAVTAAPLMALAFMTPSQEEFGKASHSLLMLTNLFFRPMLIVIGFAFGTAIVRIFGQMINISFAAAFGSQVGSVTLFSFIPTFMMYVGMMMAMAQEAFTLIYMIPDKTMRWVGLQPEQTSTNLLKAFEQATQKGIESGATAAKGANQAVGKLNHAKDAGGGGGGAEGGASASG